MKFICAATGKLDFEKTSSQGSFVARASLRVQISEMWDPSYRIDWDHLLHVDCMAWECPGHFEGLTLNQQWRRVVDVVSLMKRTEDYGFNQIKWTEISSQIVRLYLSLICAYRINNQTDSILGRKQSCIWWNQQAWRFNNLVKTSNSF